MSIYNCLAILKNGDLKIEGHPFAVKLNDLIRLLYQIAENDQYENLSFAINEARVIRNLMFMRHLENDADVLSEVIDDLQHIEEHRCHRDDMRLAAIRKIEARCEQLNLDLYRFLVVPIAQDLDFRVGNYFGGACFGLSHAYSKWRLQFPEKDIRELSSVLHLSLDVCRAQINQHSPDFLKNDYIQEMPVSINEAEIGRCGQRIIGIIEQSPGTEFSLSCFNTAWFGVEYPHEMRVSYDNSGNVFLFDANYGVFQFTSLLAFADAFNQLLRIYKNSKSSIQYNRFEVTVLKQPCHKVLVANVAEDEVNCVAALYSCFVFGVTRLAQVTVSSGGKLLAVTSHILKYLSPAQTGVHHQHEVVQKTRFSLYHLFQKPSNLEGSVESLPVHIKSI